MMLSVFIFGLSIIITLIALLLTLIKRKKSLLKKEILIIIPLFIFLYFYTFNHNFNLFIKSNTFPAKKCKVEYSSLEPSGIIVYLPPKSVYLYRTPTKVYYSNCNYNQCINFFNKNLLLMKNSKKIKDYNYDNSTYKFYIILNNNKHFQIQIDKNDNNTVYYDIGTIDD